ncbi:OmpA family protein, partial [Algoriphagus namhaensis]
MKRLAKIFMIGTIVLLSSVGVSQAQKSKLRYADQQVELLNYKTALELYQQVYAKNPELGTAQKIAETYDEIRDYDNAYKWWETTVGYEEAGMEQYQEYLKSAQRSGNLSEARAMLESKGLLDSVSVSEYIDKRSKRNVKPENVESLNSSESDFGLAMDAQGNKYFTSDRGGSYVDEMPGIRIDGRNKIFSEEKQDYTGREYFSVYKEDEEGNISEVISQVPNTYNFADPSYAKEAGVLFYSVTRGIEKVKKDREIEVFPEIYYSTVTEEGTLEGFMPFPFNDSIGYAVMHPFVDEEAKRLYFASNMNPDWSDSTKKSRKEPKY